MNPKLTLLGLFIATLPFSVNAPALRDSVQGHETRLAVAGDIGQFAVIHRGCEGQVIEEVHSQLRSGAIQVEHEFPSDLVIGVRGGQVHEKVVSAVTSVYFPVATPEGERTNRYVNPYVGFEGRWAGVGAGWLQADHGFVMTEHELIHPDFSAHLRFGDRNRNFTVRWMEDLPLESEGYFSMESGFPVARNGELAVYSGMIGPYEGVVLGLKGRVWLTPQAALQIRMGLGGHSQYSVGAGANLRFGGR